MVQREEALRSELVPGFLHDTPDMMDHSSFSCLHALPCERTIFIYFYESIRIVKVHLLPNTITGRTP